MIQDAANKAGEESGDGTTTCTVLAKAILEEGHKIQNKNIEIRRGI